MTTPLATALLLAGRREGTLDPLAAAHGVTHKCLVPIRGRPLIAHVLAALEAAPTIGRIIVSIDVPDRLLALPDAARLAAQGRLEAVRARRSLFDSIADAAGRTHDWPLIVTTADNVLLTGDALERFDTAARASGAGAAVAFAREDAVKQAHPDGQRRFYRFRDGGFSNCNLYWLAGPQALAAVESFRGGGQFAKHPARIVAAFGVINLLRFRFGFDTLAGALRHIGRRFGIAIAPVIMDDGRLAIDVDNERTYAIAAGLLGQAKDTLAA